MGPIAFFPPIPNLLLIFTEMEYRWQYTRTLLPQRIIRLFGRFQQGARDPLQLFNFLIFLYF